MNCEIPLQLAGSKTYLSIFGPCLIVLLILVAIAVFGTNTNQKKLAILAAIIINIGVLRQQPVGLGIIGEFASKSASSFVMSL